MKSGLKFIGAIFAGVLLPFAFAPVGLYGLAILSPFVLLLLLQHSSPKQALYQGLGYGIGFFGVGVYWVFISIYLYGQTNLFLAGLITAGFILILSLFPAIMAYIFTKLFINNHKSSKYILAFPSLWVLLEWVRSWFLTGFPWLLLGESQTRSPLHGFAPVVGIYGLSFLVLVTSGLLFLIVDNIKKSKPKSTIKFILSILLIWLTGYGLSFIHWTKPISNLFSVSLVQGNIKQDLKWSPHQAQKSLDLYKKLSMPYLGKSPMIIWPEAAITYLLPDAIPHLNDLNKIAQKDLTGIITGIPIPAHQQYYNGAIVLGDGSGHYFKQHLVPFGEYVPFEQHLRGLFGFLNLPMSDFSAGPSHQPLFDIRAVKIAPFICYEIAYSSLVRDDLPEANVLVTVSDDAWFNQSAALAQHTQIAQFAAEMTQRYMLVDTNSGETAIINPDGKILIKAPINTATVITANIKAMAGNTPWTILGNLPILILIFLNLYLAYIFQKKP